MAFKLMDELGKTPAGRAALDRERIALLTDELRCANRQYARLLVLSGGTGVVLAVLGTWERGGWMSAVEAGRDLRSGGYRYLGEAEIGIKEKD